MSVKGIISRKWRIMAAVLAISLLSIIFGYTFTESPNQLMQTVKMKFAGSMMKDVIDSTHEEYTIIEHIRYGSHKFSVVQIKSVPSHTSSFVRYLETIHHGIRNSTRCQRSIYNLILHQCCAVQHTVSHLYSLGFTHVQFARRPQQKTLSNNGNNTIGCLGLHIAENKEIAFAHLYKLSDKTELYYTVIQKTLSSIDTKNRIICHTFD
eukprot:995319_1